MLILLLPLGGCATTAGRATDPCAGWAPIYPSRQDVLTDGTARQIKAHDEYGARMGCWNRPTPKSAKPDSATKAAAAH